VRVVFLGTSGAVPTSRRALPAVALVYNGQIVLFDCGEGTQRQLILAGFKLTRVRHVLISHLHADHVLGLPGLVISRGFIGGREPLDVYGPPGLAEFLRSTIRRVAMEVEYLLRIHETRGGVLWEGEDFQLIAEPLQHRTFCLGFAFVERDRPGRFDAERAKELGLTPGPVFGELKRGGSATLPDGRVIHGEELLGPPIPGRKIAYVVDTVPCPGAESLAQDADLLIFDSTLAAGAEEDAGHYGHATAKQALEIAAKAHARRLVLFHSSPRYEDPTELLAGLPATGIEVIVPEDFQAIEIPRRSSKDRG